MSRLAALLLVGVAIIHFLPLPGLLGAERLSQLYGVTVADPGLELLMRHRAAMFGVIGAVILAGAFRRRLQVTALLVGFASVISFLVLAYTGSEPNAAIGRVVVADWIALGLLAGASLLVALDRRKQTRPMFRERREN
ncbi:MAG TPA: hypothetical protein VFO79_09230 [Xanthomonadales bacterium]|nr:hypothetical protein [Xanthomonadales bacterium]